MGEGEGEWEGEGETGAWRRGGEEEGEEEGVGQGVQNKIHDKLCVRANLCSSLGCHGSKLFLEACFDLLEVLQFSDGPVPAVLAVLLSLFEICASLSQDLGDAVREEGKDRGRSYDGGGGGGGGGREREEREEERGGGEEGGGERRGRGTRERGQGVIRGIWRLDPPPPPPPRDSTNCLYFRCA